MMWPRSLRAWSFSGCQPTGFHIPPAPPPTSPSRPAARPRSGKRRGRALPAVRRCASFHVSMRVPNPSLWPHCASRCWGAHPGVSWTPCRGRTSPVRLDPVHPPGREDRGVGAVAPASRTDRHRAAARVRVPDERVAAPQAHETHWRLVRGTVGRLPLIKGRLLHRSCAPMGEPASRLGPRLTGGLFASPSDGAAPSRSADEVLDALGGEEFVPKLHARASVDRAPPQGALVVVPKWRLSPAAAWCASGSQCAPHGARRQGVRGPEPGLDRCSSPESAPRAVTKAVLVAGRRVPQACAGSLPRGGRSTDQRWWF